jgi:RHS repeat-associated protein
MSLLKKISQGACCGLVNKAITCGVKALALSVLVSALPAQAVTSISRVSAYDYNSTTGQLSKEISEPGNNDLCVAVEYIYDDRGNVKSTTQRNCSGQSGGYAGSSATTNTEAAAPGTGSFAPFPARVAMSATKYNTDGTVTVTGKNAEGEAEERVFGVAFGELKSLKDANGLITQWAYDGFGRKILELRPDGNGTTWTYELCATNAGGGKAQCPSLTLYSGYDVPYPVVLMHVVTEQQVTHPINGSIDIASGTGAVTSGAYLKRYYDAFGRLTLSETQGFDGASDGVALQAPKVIYQTTSHDSYGRLVAESRPYYAGETPYLTRYTYDVLGRVVLITAPDTSKTTVVYAGLNETTTNDLSQVIIKTKDLNGHIVKIQDAYSKALNITYDAFGNILTTNDSAGNIIAMQYDVRGNKISMQDPDLGVWTYKYDALGQRVKETDAKAQATTYIFDMVGRKTNENNTTLNFTWAYGIYADGVTPCPMGAGRLCEAKTAGSYSRKNSYDAQGRLSSVSHSIGNAVYSKTYQYDPSGRILGLTYPTGLVVQNAYTPLGYIWKLVDNAARPTVAYWKALEMDAELHLTKQAFGNGVVSVNSYFTDTGRIKSTTAGSSVQNVNYTYDTLGNLKTRSDVISKVNQSFTYDMLNRLQTEIITGGALSTPAVVSWAYDAAGIGNIQSRSDIGNYSYNPGGANSIQPHAVAGVIGSVDGIVNPTYKYDANGNLTSMTGVGGSRNVSWSSYNMAQVIRQTIGSTTNHMILVYGPEHTRVQMGFYKNNKIQSITNYVNPGAGTGLFYEEEKNSLSGVWTQKHYLNVGSETIGSITFENNVYKGTQYWHKDNLGSPMVVTDAGANVTERLSYEPFGRRRNVDGTNDSSGVLASKNTRRGFTEHEMLEEVGLVNMNGRIYDPAIGRFLSPDPDIPYPGDMQSYSRYSYARNRPLSVVDPTGFTDGGDCSICFSLYGSNSGPGGSFIVGGGVGIPYGQGSGYSAPSIPKPVYSPAPVAVQNNTVSSSSFSSCCNSYSLTEGLTTFGATYQSVVGFTASIWADASGFMRGYSVGTGSKSTVLDIPTATWDSDTFKSGIQAGQWVGQNVGPLAAALSVFAAGDSVPGVSSAGGVFGFAAKGTTTLYRAVGPAELASINKSGAFLNIAGIEGKYFTTSAAEASAYAKQAVRAFGDAPYTTVRTQVPNSFLKGLSPVTVDGGIPAWVLPTDRLKGLVPNVMDHSVLPPLGF